VKVLHIVKTAVGATWAYEQVRVLVGLGVDVVVALPSAEQGLAPDYRRAGAKVIGVNLDFPARRPWQLPGVLAACRKLVADVQPDLIHTHHVGTTLVVRLALGKRSKIPRVFQVPGPLHLESPTFANLEMSLAGPPDYWIATCEWTRRKYLELGVAPNRVFLSYAGTDVNRFSPAGTGTLRAELGLSADVPLVGMVAYMYAPKWFLGQDRGLKGHEDFFAALNLVRQDWPDVRGVVIGGAWGDAAWYEDLLRYRGGAICDGSLTFLGTRSDVATLYPDLDLAVVPSHSECCSRGVVEPLLSGVPVVATNVGGLPDLIHEGETGWLVPPRDPAALSRAIVEALQNRDEALRRTIVGRKLACELFDIGRHAKVIAGFYSGILSPIRGSVALDVRSADKAPIRILHVLGSLDPGGVETWLMHVLRHIDRDRFRLDFCTLGTQAGLYAPEAERFGSRVLRCPRDLGLRQFRRRFIEILREGRYDVVHSHVHLFSGVLLRWAQDEGVPVRIAHSHTSCDGKASTLSRRFYQRLMKSWIHRYATHGLGASQPAARQLFGAGWARDSRFQVLHCGIDLGPFEEPITREEVRRELGIPVDVAVVGHVGRFVAAKNHAFFLDIAAEIAKRRPDVHFLLVGDGPLRPSIEARAAAMGFNGNMHFAGSRADVPRILRGAMDAFVFPSLWEGLPIALLEAQLAGLRCYAGSSIDPEAADVGGGLRVLGEAASAMEWAETIAVSLGRPPVNKDSLFASWNQSPFSIRTSSGKLTNLYERGA